ncbi:retrovirus-related pol polyprotein from transposon TNT 1-94, partial [Tanacetum coccineum]
VALCKCSNTRRPLGAYNIGVATPIALVYAGLMTSGDARSWYMIRGDVKSWVSFDKGKWMVLEIKVAHPWNLGFKTERDEVHKFCDGTLLKVQDNLLKILKENSLGRGNVKLEGREWTKNNIKRSEAMLEKINKTLKYKEQLKRLEEYVGGRPKIIDIRSFDSVSDVEKDTRSINEFLVKLNVEFHDKALLANQKRFYKILGRVGVARKPMHKSNETCFACGKQEHFQKDCPTNKTSTPFHPSSNKIHNKPKFLTNSSSSSHQHNQTAGNDQKNYKVKYKALKAELALLTQKIKVVLKQKREKGLVAESFDWDEESLSSEDEEESMLNKFNSLKQELSSCKSELIDLKNTKVQNLTLQHEIARLNLDNESLKDEVYDLKKVIEKWTSSKVTLDQHLTEQIPGNIVRVGDNYPYKNSPDFTSDTEYVNDNQEPLPPLSKLLRAEPIGTSKYVTTPTNLIQTSIVFDKTKQVLEKKSLVKSIKKKAQTKTPYVPDSKPKKKVDSSTKQLLLTLMEEVKGLKE